MNKDKFYQKLLLFQIAINVILNAILVYVILLNPDIVIFYLLTLYLMGLNTIYIRICQNEKESLKTTIQWLNEYTLKNI